MASVTLANGPAMVTHAAHLPSAEEITFPYGFPQAGDYRLFVHLRAIRQGNYKLVLDLEDGKKELYDLSKDPAEKSDVSAAEPRTAYELEQGLRTWMDETRTNPQDYLGQKQKPITIF